MRFVDAGAVDGLGGTAYFLPEQTAFIAYIFNRENVDPGGTQTLKTANPETVDRNPLNRSDPKP